MLSYSKSADPTNCLISSSDQPKRRGILPVTSLYHGHKGEPESWLGLGDDRLETGGDRDSAHNDSSSMDGTIGLPSKPAQVDGLTHNDRSPRGSINEAPPPSLGVDIDPQVESSRANAFPKITGQKSSNMTAEQSSISLIRHSPNSPYKFLAGDLEPSSRRSASSRSPVS